MALKRFIADWALAHPDESRAKIPSGILSKDLEGKRIAVVGAGPAGLTCAQELVRQGCTVSVYEALPVPGGMMRVGVPAYRLPPDVIQYEIDQIIAEGIDLRLNQRVDDVEGLL